MSEKRKRDQEEVDETEEASNKRPNVALEAANVTTDFHRFNKLPAELRQMIWNLVLDQDIGTGMVCIFSD